MYIAKALACVWVLHSAACCASDSKTLVVNSARGSYEVAVPADHQDSVQQDDPSDHVLCDLSGLQAPMLVNTPDGYLVRLEDEDEEQAEYGSCLERAVLGIDIVERWNTQGERAHVCCVVLPRGKFVFVSDSKELEHQAPENLSAACLALIESKMRLLKDDLARVL